MPELYGLGIGAMNFGSGLLNGAISRQENFKYNEKAAENADRRYRNLYKDLMSPSAQLQQLKDAGLSPAMYYAGNMAGNGGATGMLGAGAAGITNQTAQIDPLTMAQIKNIDADTNLKNEQAEQVAPKAQADIAEKLANAGYKDAAKAYSFAQEKAQELANYITDRSKEHKIYTLCANAEEAGNAAIKAYYDAVNSKIEMEFNQTTYDDRCKIVNKQLEELCTLIDVNRSKWRLNDTQSRLVHNETLAMWERIDQGWRALDIEQQNTTNYATWLEEQIPILKDQLKIRFKELDIEKEHLIIDAITETLKSFAIGAAAVSQFGKGSNQTPPRPEGIHRGNKTNLGAGWTEKTNYNTWY